MDGMSRPADYPRRMATRTTKVPDHLRVRRKPEDAEREILDSAEKLLATSDFRDLTVSEVMAGTGMARSAFYTYFESSSDLVLRLLQRIEAEMMAAAEEWLGGSMDDPRESIDEGLLQVASVYARHGRVIRAIHEASYHDREVERAYRHVLIDGFVSAVADRIRAENAAGRTNLEDPDAVAEALLILNANFFVEHLGALGRVEPPEAVAGTLALVWRRTIYPQLDAG